MELWTLGELAERVEAALADYPGQVNGRVRAVPDQRAIRWYTTTGLIDRPTEMRGRTALYGPRHLLQLVAIKRRQSQGHTLAQIQAELSGATNETLQPIAALPDPIELADPSTPANRTALPSRPPEPATAPARARFWANQPPPRPVDAAPADPRALLSASTPASALARPADAEIEAGVVFAVRVGDGVTVVLDRGVGVGVDVERLAAAAGPLLAELARQGLVYRPSSGDET